MKRFFIIFLALIYVGSSSGMALQIHYCMDKISGLSLLEDEKKDCGKCGMEKDSNSCCKDETKFLKLEDAHKLLSLAYVADPPVATISSLTYHYLTSPAINKSVPLFSSNAPPECKIPLHIFHCVFIV